jgi:protein-disulfide isomerase
MHRSPLATLVLSLFLLAPAAVNADSDDRREEIERIVKEYLLREPEVLYEALQELQKKREAAEIAQQRELVVANRVALFEQQYDPVVGNEEGDVTLVEFFDYRCSYCRQMMPGIREMLETDGGIRLVLKDFPILGPESTTAAKAALAAERQGRYGDMHWALMQEPELSEDTVMRVAADLGLDVERLEEDMKSPEVAKAIEANLALARTLGINGTPSFVLADRVIPGAIPAEELQKLVQAERKGG